MIVETTHPIAGPMRQPRPAARFEQTPAEVRSFAPVLGQHTEEVLRELEFGAAEIQSLRQTGVVG
jgi:crotonobetainyl-CoA:carnitine CoA-transferase CaiB-like acyl-CoA transferase